MSRSIKKNEECPCRTKDYVPLTDVRYSGIETVLMPRLGVLRTRVYYTTDIEMGVFDTQDIAVVKYCPLCGRELEAPHE